MNQKLITKAEHESAYMYFSSKLGKVLSALVGKNYDYLSKNYCRLEQEKSILKKNNEAEELLILINLCRKLRITA